MATTNNNNNIPSPSPSVLPISSAAALVGRSSREGSTLEVQFVHALSPQLICPICHDLFRVPLITRHCSHSFCSQCIQRSLEGEPSCPVCRFQLGTGDLHPNLALAGIIDELQVYCQYRNFGCKEKIEFQNKLVHESRCPFAPTQCPHAFNGCRFQGNAEIVRKHVASECIFEHMKAFIERTENQIEMLTKEVQRQKDEIMDLKYSLLHSTNGAINLKLIDPKTGAAAIENSEAESPSHGGSHWYQSDLKCRHTLTCHSGVTSLEYMEESNLLFSGGHDGSTKVWDMQLDIPVRTLDGKQRTVWALSYDRRRENLYCGSSDGSIKIWNLGASGKQSGADVDTKGTYINAHNGRINSMAIFNDRLFSASYDKTIKCWNLEDGSCVATLEGHADGVNSIVRLNGTQFATGSNDRTVKIWNIDTLTCERTIEVGSSEVLCVRAGDGLLFTAGYDSNILVYSLNDYHRICRLTGHAWEVWQLAFAGNYTLFSGSFDHKIKRWDLRNQRCSATLGGHKGFVHALTIGKEQLISGCADRTIKLWGKAEAQQS